MPHHGELTKVAYLSLAYFASGEVTPDISVKVRYTLRYSLIGLLFYREALSLSTSCVGGELEGLVLTALTQVRVQARA